MARKRRDDLEGLDRVLSLLERAPAGLHDVTPPAATLPAGLPPPLLELYARCDGLTLYLETVEIAAAAEVTDDGLGRWRFATVEGDPIAIDARGKIWRSDESLDDHVCDGTRLDRWLAGTLDALALIYDEEGEFNDDVFDELGDVVPAVRERQLRAHLRRDAGAAGVRWRLGHALLEVGSTIEARDELEQAVADDPAFSWGWLDLARISEAAGELGNAIDEARMAAEAADGARHPQAGYFWAQLARLAARAGDELQRAQAATRTSLLAPDLKRAQLDGARASLADGDDASARGLVELLRAVWPRDLEVLELAKRVDAAGSPATPGT